MAHVLLEDSDQDAVSYEGSSSSDSFAKEEPRGSDSLSSAASFDSSDSDFDSSDLEESDHSSQANGTVSEAESVHSLQEAFDEDSGEDVGDGELLLPDKPRTVPVKEVKAWDQILHGRAPDSIPKKKTRADPPESGEGAARRIALRHASLLVGPSSQVSVGGVPLRLKSGKQQPDDKVKSKTARPKRARRSTEPPAEGPADVDGSLAIDENMTEKHRPVRIAPTCPPPLTNIPASRVKALLRTNPNTRTVAAASVLAIGSAAAAFVGMLAAASAAETASDGRTGITYADITRAADSFEEFSLVRCALPADPTDTAAFGRAAVTRVKRLRVGGRGARSVQNNPVG